MTTIEERYLQYLIENPTVHKIPYIHCVPELTEKIPVEYKTTSNPNVELPKEPTWDILRDINIKKSKKTGEDIIQMYQRALPIKKFGRIRGNIEYLEDCWNIQIQPISFKYAYADSGVLGFTESGQSKIRDKYVKIRVRYDGTQYVMVNAVKTNYTISYA